MTVRIEKYNAPPEFIQAQLELMNRLSNDIRKKTEAPEGACAMVALRVVEIFLETMKAELNIGVVQDEEPEKRH